MSLIDLTKTGTTYRERYIIPTILVPPTGTVEQAGPHVRGITPGTTNRGDARLTTSGLLRDVASNDPTIVVRVKGSGQAQNGGAIVPVVSIQRTNALGPTDGSEAKLTRTFDLHSSYSFRPTATNLVDYWHSLTGVFFMLYDAPILLQDINGTFVSIVMARENGNYTRADVHGLTVHAYTPGLDTAWRRVAFSWLSTLLGVAGDTYTNVIASAAAQHSNGTLYVAFGSYSGSATDGSKLYVAAVNGDTANTTVDSSTLQLISGPATITTGRVSGASMIFLPTGQQEALIAFGVIDYDPTVTTITGRRIIMMRSPDLRTWATAGGDAVLPEIGSTNLIQSSMADSETVRFAAHCWGDSTHGWAVSEDGRIFALDANKSAVGCAVPQPDSRYATVRLNAVAAASNGSAFTVYAAGALVNVNGIPSGIIYKSTDSGVTWKVVPTWHVATYFEADDLTAPYNDALAWNEKWILPIYAIALTSDLKGWFVGDRGYVGYTADGQATRVWVRNIGTTAGRLYAVVADTSDNILVAGEAQDTGELTTAASRLCRAVLIENATTAIALNDAACTYLCPQTTDDDAPIAALSNAVANTTALTDSGSILYALTTAGVVWRRKWVTSAFVWASIATLPRGAEYTDLGAVVGTADNVLVTASGFSDARSRSSSRAVRRGGLTGTVWQSTTANQASPAFTAIATVGYPFESLAVTSLTNATVVGGHRIWSLVSQSAHFLYPALQACPDGSILFGRANITLGALEIFRAADARLDWQLVDRSVFFTASTPTSVSSNTLRPTFQIDQNGDVLLLAGTSSRMSSDNGRTWYAPLAPDTTPNAPLPLGVLTSATNYTNMNWCRYRQAFALMGNGRLWSTREKDTSGGDPTETLGVFVSRDWSTSGSDYLPIQNQSFWAGIDGLAFRIEGSAPVGDYWTLSTIYQYGVANFTLYESPSIVWRSKSDRAELVILWDRQATAVVDVLGTGLFFDVSAWAIFGSNVRQVYFELSDPTNDAAFTTTYLSALSADAGTCANVGARVSDVLACYSTYPGTPKAWTPGQYTAGMRQYYVAVAGGSNIGGTTTANAATAIVGSGTSFTTMLTVGDEISLSSAATTYARITAIADATHLTVDAALGNGSSQTINKRERVLRVVSNTASHLVVDGLVAIATTTTYIIYGDRHAYCDTSSRDGTTRFGRYARIRIPAQATPDGYAAIGTPILGIEPPPDTEGRSFAYGIQWAPVVNTTQQRALSGITSVEHHGRLGQVWALAYAAQRRDAVLRKLQPFGNRLRMPFALLFDGTAEGAELVRLVDAQKYQNLLGDRWDSTWAMEEVV